MGVIALGGIKVSRARPKISVKIVNNNESMVSAELRLRRVGMEQEFVAYTPSRVSDDFVEFTFDELLFTKAVGRYRARFLINDLERTIFHLQLEDDRQFVVTGSA